MSHVQQVAITRALALLKSVNAQFKIITPEGEEHGELEVVVPKVRKRTAGPYEYRALTQHITPYLTDMNPGDMVLIPLAEFDRERLRGAVTAWICTHWGNGSAITSCKADMDHVEVLRVS